MADDRKSRPLVLLVDDDDDLRDGITRYLRASGYETTQAADGAEAARQWGRLAPDAIVLDLALPDVSGIDLLDRIREKLPNTPVVMLTGNASIGAAVESIKRGAENFLTKPVDTAALVVVLERALANRTHRLRALAAPRAGTSPDPFLGKSPAIQRLREDAMRLLATDRPVLLLGETGTGKGVLARWLHAHGPRNKQAFVDLNCAGLSRDLLESELFGHEAGAFTGATRSKPGLLEEAHRGIVFLDEVAEMEASVQAKLLKALEERRIRRLGDTRERVVDFRLIAATHRDLAACAKEGRFREDLYYRLSTFPLKLPALRDRLEDLPEITAWLLAGFAAEIGRPRLRLGPGAIEALCSRSWRGNIRELRNVIERAALFADDDLVGPGHLVGESSDAASPPSLASGTEDWPTLDELERRHVMRALQAENNRILPTARRLGIARSSLYQKLRRYGISLNDPDQTPSDETPPGKTPDEKL